MPRPMRYRKRLDRVAAALRAAGPPPAPALFATENASRLRSFRLSYWTPFRSRIPPPQHTLIQWDAGAARRREA